MPSGRLPRAGRAQQFMPFAALKGYYDLVRERARVVQPRHELTEEEVLALSAKLAQVKRRTMVHVTHYDGEAYVVAHGLVSDIDLANRTITVVRTNVAFSDMLDLRGEGIEGEEEA